MGISTYLFRGEKYLRGMPNKQWAVHLLLAFLTLGIA